MQCWKPSAWPNCAYIGRHQHQEIEETLLKPYLTLPYTIIVPMCIHWNHSDTHLDHASYCLGELLVIVICIQQYQFCQAIWLYQVSSSLSQKYSGSKVHILLKMIRHICGCNCYYICSAPSYWHFRSDVSTMIIIGTDLSSPVLLHLITTDILDIPFMLDL